MPDQEEEKKNKSRQGCLKFLLGIIVGIFICPVVLWGVLFLTFILPPTEEVEWHEDVYFLQYESSLEGTTGHHLLYLTNGQKIELLPHVYGYYKDGDFIYFAAGQGYAIVDTKRRTADIVLMSDKISQVKARALHYYADLNALKKEQREKLLAIPHTLQAYNVTRGKDGGYTPIGDGRFQYSQFHSVEGRRITLEAYGMKDDFDYPQNILCCLTGYHSEGEKFYAISPEGYAIVDGLSSTCRVYFTNSDLAGKDYHEDIQVLNDYEDFTPEEREILERVKKEGFQ